MTEKAPERVAPEMILTAFMLADHAEAVNGKLYVAGGCWNQISAANFPAVHGHMSVAMAIQVPWTASNERHSVEVRVLDADGKSILPGKIGGEFEVGRPPGWRPGDDHTVVIVFNLNGVPFPNAGQYAAVALIDERELGRLRLSLAKVPSPVRTG